jgi:flagellar biosynthesis protein FlhF
MHLKRYRSASVQEALALARTELGPDALVLSTRLVAADGPRGWFGAREVEVTAAADRPERLAMSESRPARRWFRQLRGLSAPACAEATATERAPRPRAAAAPQDMLVARLCAAGLDHALASDVVSRLPRGRSRDLSVVTLRRAVAERLEHLTAGGDPPAAVEVFVGPPGVGKTTTIAKIAAQARVRRGERVTLVAADGFRVGAIEQLRIYAEIIGSRFFAVRTPSELERALAQAKGPIVVDTAGRSPRDPEAQALFDVFAGFPGVRTHLVLPAGIGVHEGARVIAGFEGARPGRVALTKLDEAPSLGALVELLRDRRLRVSYLGTGQRVPEDLERATAPAMAAYLLGEAPCMLEPR